MTHPNACTKDDVHAAFQPRLSESLSLFEVSFIGQANNLGRTTAGGVRNIFEIFSETGWQAIFPFISKVNSSDGVCINYLYLKALSMPLNQARPRIGPAF
jgi:hypothetical protein